MTPSLAPTYKRMRATEFLKDHPGHACCDDCLASRVGLTVREVRYARVRLAGSPEFEQHTWFCSFCLEVRDVIHVAWMHFGAPPARDELREAF